MSTLPADMVRFGSIYDNEHVSEDKCRHVRRGLRQQLRMDLGIAGS